MRAHGTWKVTRVRNVVVQTNGGDFNQQGVLGVFEEIKALAPVGQPWAALVDAISWDMGAMDTLATIAECRRWMHANGCVHNACVMPPSLRRDLHQLHAGGLPADVQRYFSTLEEACAWLTEGGFAFSVADYPHPEFAQLLALRRQR